MSAGEGDQTYHLADGLLVVHGHGAARDLLDRHLLRATGSGGTPTAPVLVSIELVDSAEPAAEVAGGHVVRGRRGCAVVTGGPGRGAVDVVWDRGWANARPLLAAAHLAARERNAVLLHAATVASGGRAVAIAGPSGGGKTAAALAAMRRGATLVAPEWVWVEVATGMARGLPQPLRLRPHHTAHLSKLPPGAGVLRAAKLLPGPVRRRVHVDIPFASVAGECSAVRLVAMLVVSRLPSPASGDIDPVAAVAAATADDLAGVESTDLVTELAGRIRVVAGSTDDALALVDRP